MKKIFILIIVLLLLIFISNNWITVSHHSLTTGKTLEKKLRILQVSDLHSKTFPMDQSSLIKAIEKQEADIIVMTGDIIDSRKPNPSAVYQLLEGLNTSAEIYYVTGNHENVVFEYPTFEKQLSDYGVHVINNKSVTLESGITLVGIHDYTFFSGFGQYADTLNKLAPIDDTYSILLSHRPELIDLYAQNNFNLVLSGHAHGGQFRLPKVGGLFAPNQGLFPKYTAGIHTVNQTNLIISRGLGNSLMPIRIFNQPELVVIELE